MAINIRYTGAMDIKIKTATMNFHYCARAIIKQDEKVLLIQVNDAGYYHLPGGHVAIGETTKQALLREIQEETGLMVRLDRLAVVNEQFYNKKDTANHSLIFYYLAHPTKQVITENSIRMEQGPTKLIKNELRWVTLTELKNLDFRPERIKNLIIKNEFKTLQHIIG